MIWTTYQTQKMKPETKQWLMKKTMILILLLMTAAVIAVYLLFFRGPQGEVLESQQFDDAYNQVCASPKLPPLEYRGVESFFTYLTKPDDQHCYSWVEFGGEKIPIPSQSEAECNDEIRKTKFMCFNEEYEMTADPCLVYSFSKDMDDQFERDMNMFSCEVHAFDHEKVTVAEHTSRTEFWKEHSWDIAEFPYDKNNDDGSVIKRRSLNYIVKSLGHEGREMKFLKSDLEGREWILLKQIITHSDLIDIRQIGVRLHIPISVNKMSGESRHSYFAKLFKIFQGLNCLGYKYVLGRAIRYYKGAVRIPEMKNQTFFPAYEVNWVKMLPSK
ncbi:unnamed protein product [Meganyctiphanes norvegica]|uniref:Methyltransferase domain-containing protein n=1 Tax=Meganyctiphanes norvegica TaxID=48144 RepID=A0AAV2R0K1_MEGNR